MSEDVRNIFHEQLIKYMRLRGKTQSDISKDLNLSLTTVSGWYHGKNFPRPDKMQLLADYLHVQVEDLIKKDDDISYNFTFKNEKQRETITTLRRATEHMDNNEMDDMLDMLNIAFKEAFKNDK